MSLSRLRESRPFRAGEGRSFDRIGMGLNDSQGLRTFKTTAPHSTCTKSAYAARMLLMKLFSRSWVGMTDRFTDSLFDYLERRPPYPDRARPAERLTIG